MALELIKPKLFIVKIGGNVVNNPVVLSRFLKKFAHVKEAKILVHGGGKILESLAFKLGIEQKMIDGRRITDAETLNLALMVYAGLINKKVVAELQAFNCNALGLTGADLNLVKSIRRSNKQIDYGFVGDVSAGSINTETIGILLKNKIVPVFCALTHDGASKMLNTNADSLTGALASALAPHYEIDLHYCFEKRGVLYNSADENSVIPKIRVHEVQQMVDKQIVSEGMIPKLQTAFNAVKSGVKTVVIGHADDLEMNQNQTTNRGTLLSL